MLRGLQQLPALTLVAVTHGLLTRRVVAKRGNDDKCMQGTLTARALQKPSSAMHLLLTYLTKTCKAGLSATVD